MKNKIFKSKLLAAFLIYSFILLINIETFPQKVNFDSDEKFEPVVKAREGNQEVTSAQKDRFERLIEEGKRLLQQEMDYEGAIRKFKEAEEVAVSNAQKADSLFYLSLAYYAHGEKITDELNQALRNLIEIDYYRELDMRLCSPRYVELFQGIKKDYGVLRVQSKPAGADVYINDSQSPLGKTPFTLGCKAGSVRVKVKRGKREKKDIFKVVAGKETAPPVYVFKGGTSLLLVAGGIALAGGAGAALLLKGKKGGEEATTGSIQVNSSPTGAKVFFNEIDTGKITNCTLTNIAPGTHKIELFKDGYEDFGDLVSVTAGQTATVNANLTAHIITVTNPTGSTSWSKGSDLEIKWNTSGLLNSQSNSNISPRSSSSSNPGRYPLSSVQRRDFQNKRSFLSSAGAGRRIESIDSSKNMEIISTKPSRLSSISEKLTSFSKDVNIFHQKVRGAEVISRNISLRRIGLADYPRISLNGQGHSPRAMKPSGELKVLGLLNVKIDLYRANSLVQTIAQSTENDGSYTWRVDPSLEEGTGYRIRVSCASDSGVYGQSNEFRITPGYEFVLKWGSDGTGDGQFKDPMGIAVDSSGYVYVVDYHDNRVQKFTSDGTFVTKWGEDGQFGSPAGIAVDHSGYVYVADTYGLCIQKFDSNGNFVSKWGTGGSGDGQFLWALGIAVDNSGYVYVADTRNYRIQKFTSDGAFVTKWGSQGSGDGQFEVPDGIAVDSSGYVYVADGGNNRIQKFTSDGTFVTKWGGYVYGDNEFIGPCDIAIDNSDYVYVVDGRNYKIKKFTSDGTFVTKWGSMGPGDGQFSNPNGIAVDSSGYVYVSDRALCRIQKFQPISSGQPLLRNSPQILNNNFLTNKSPIQKSNNIRLPLQNRLKEKKE